MSAPKPLKPHFVLGLLKAPALDDPAFVTAQEAINVAMDNQEEFDVMCIWDERGETCYVVYQGEVFKREG